MKYTGILTIKININLRKSQVSISSSVQKLSFLKLCIREEKKGSANIEVKIIMNIVASIRSGWYPQDITITTIITIDISNMIKNNIKFQLKNVIINTIVNIELILTIILLLLILIIETIIIIQIVKLTIQNERRSPMKMYLIFLISLLCSLKLNRIIAADIVILKFLFFIVIIAIIGIKNFRML